LHKHFYHAERKNLLTQTETFPRSLGPWSFSANDVAGQLTLIDDGSGNLSGTIDGNQQVLGFWDATAQKVTFLRILDPADPSTVQVYTGYLSSHLEGIDLIVYTLLGSYQAFSGPDVTAQRNVFGWSATMSRPVG
jgi:hypothetical protein